MIVLNCHSNSNLNSVCLQAELAGDLSIGRKSVHEPAQYLVLSLLSVLKMFNGLGFLNLGIFLIFK